MLPKLIERWHVFSIDLIGMGASSRRASDLPSDVDAAIDYFIERLERWRIAVGLTTFVLAGHSLGGYLSVCYSMRYRKHVETLILISPAGIRRKDDDQMENLKMNRSGCLPGFVRWLWSKKIGPFDLARFCCIGPCLLRYGFRRRFAFLPPAELNALVEYYLAIAELPPGTEDCLFVFFERGAMARKPLEDDIMVGHQNLPIHFFYGDNDWMDSRGAARLARALPYVTLSRVSNSGHQITLENPQELAERMILSLIHI
eukprot:TRINITY_DN19533_c0_g2_i1.p1 TRINITY_DN19533_c0_g2~~TRINITY_DN19533_c0_g2_i1.p1  ORF type:complete len:258 (-),score=48.13 TRINITY_DN19533_c0_g2_i1:61-834(-)